MEPIFTIMFLTFLIALSLGIYILVIDITNKIHILFFLLATNMALWNLFASMAFSASTEKSMWLFFKTGALFEIISVSLTLHFILSLTHPKINPFSIIAVYIPSLPIHYRNWASFFVFNEVEREQHRWVLKPAFHSFWMHYWDIYFETIVIISLIVLFRWIRHTKIKREKQQARTLFYSLLSYVTICIIGDYFLSPYLKLPPLSPSYLIIFLGGIFYSIIRYRFMTITQITLSKEILENVEALIILFDQNMEVIRANKKAEKYFGIPASKLIGKNSNELFYNDPNKNNQTYLSHLCINEILHGGREQVQCLIKIENKNLPDNNFTVLRINLSLVKDKNHDPLGILLVGNELPTANKFIKQFHLSQREWETIQYLNMGVTNKKIAEYMNISVRTVKTHIANIYNKLGIKSKLELIAKLREFDIFGVS